MSPEGVENGNEVNEKLPPELVRGMSIWEMVGESRDADDEKIKKGYLKLSKIYHPDLHSNSSHKDWYEEQFKHLSEAYVKYLDSKPVREPKREGGRKAQQWHNPYDFSRRSGVEAEQGEFDLERETLLNFEAEVAALGRGIEGFHDDHIVRMGKELNILKRTAESAVLTKIEEEERALETIKENLKAIELRQYKLLYLVVAMLSGEEGLADSKDVAFARIQEKIEEIAGQISEQSAKYWKIFGAYLEIQGEEKE